MPHARENEPEEDTRIEEERPAVDPVDRY